MMFTILVNIGIGLAMSTSLRGGWLITLLVAGALIGSAIGIYLGWQLTDFLPDRPSFRIGGEF